MIYTVTLNPALDKTLSATGLRPDRINRAQIIRRDWGGKGINVSRALQHLGVSSVAAGFCGGPTGRALRQGLDDLDIAHHLIEVQGETRINLTIHDQDRQVLVKLNEPGPTITLEEMGQLCAWIVQRTGPGDHWVLSGNLPPGLAPDTYALLIDQIRSRGGRACLDTSGEPLVLGVQARPFLIKPNRAEAETILAHPLRTRCHLLKALDALAEHGVAHVLLSLGADGALAAHDGKRCWARPPAVEVTSDIGAGDSMLAGYLWGLTSGYDLEDCLRRAVAAGTAAAMEEGSGVCQAWQVKELLRHVTSGAL